MSKIKYFILLTIVTTTSLLATKFVTIATSGVTGTYYPTGGAICRVVDMQHMPIKCSVKSTSGSIYNIKKVHEGEIDFAMAQSDTVYQAYHGENRFKNKPIKDLRSVMAIYPELLSLVVRKDSNINKISDIKGKIINIDVKDSGTRVTTDTILKVLKIDKNDFKVMTHKFIDCPELIKNKKIDGYFGMFGHPTDNIKEAAYDIKIDLIPIDGKPIDDLIKKYPYYFKGTIPANIYKGVNHPTPTIGVKGILVTSSTVDEDVVYKITKAILDNFETFKSLHPAYKYITKKSLLKGLTIKQHKGAIKAFKEAGLIIDNG